MKKILFLSALLSSCAILSNAFAKCTILACDNISWYEGLGWLKITNDGDQCWACGLTPNACSSKDVVPYMNANGEIISLYQCTYGFTNSFEKINPGNLCEDSPIRNTSAANTKTIYKPVGQKTTKTNVGDLKYFTGSSFCKYIYCTGDRAASSDKQSCIDLNNNCIGEDDKSNATGTVKNIECNSTLHKINSPLLSLEHIDKGKTCTGTCESNGWNITLKADSCEKDYEPDKSSNNKRCVLTDAAKQRQQQQQNAAAAEKKKRCEESGGTWSANKCTCDSQKNLVLTNGVCECLDSNYRREGMECVLTDVAALERDCRAATGTYWNTETKRCECTMDHYIFQFGSCKIDPVYESCMKIRDATWNVAQNRCVCNDADKELNDAGTACVETPEAREAREAEEQSKRTAAATQAISSAKKKLESLAEDFDQTVWKDAEGKFNTSRLASDSVAAVVLGTAGGLITSNVVKKNQVKNGFEDIQCTIGGQVVADWGDQFRVGIK